MRSLMKKLLPLLVLGLLLCTVSAASADPAAEFCFSWETEGQTVRVSPVTTYTNGNVLFLPGCCDASSLTLNITGSDSLLWDDMTLENGAQVDLSGSVGKTVTVAYADGTRYGKLKVMQGSEIPAMFVNMEAADLTHINASHNNDIREEASVVLLDGDSSLVVADTLDSFHVRGNSTRHAPKKPYQLKLSSKADLFGMGKSKTWILLANWYDVSLIRNQITLDLCRELGLSGTPECRQVDLYLNGSYNGTYLLCEKIQLTKERLNITDMEKTQTTVKENPDTEYELKIDRSHSAQILRWHQIPEETEDITGGFLLEIEKPMHFTNNKENAGFMTDGDMCVLIKEPTYVSEKAADYIANLVNDFHNAVLSTDGLSKETGKSYTEYIDMDSFAKKVIVEEFCVNYDVGAASQFMYKDSDTVDPLIHAGPGWDYDLTYGNKASGVKDPLTADYVYNRSSKTRHLYHWLLTHEEFRTLTRSLFENEMVPAVEILLGQREAPEGSCLKSLDSYIGEIADSAEMNFTLWRTSLISDLNKSSGTNFQDAAAYLKDWIIQRFGMLQTQWLTD